MDYCPNCGLPYEEDETQCLYCGAALRQPPRPAASGTPRAQQHYSAPTQQRYSSPTQPRYDPQPQPRYAAPAQQNPFDGPDGQGHPRTSPRQAPKREADNGHEFDAFRNTVKESAGKALAGAQGLANQVVRKVGETTTAMKNHAEEDVRKQYRQQEQSRQKSRKKPGIEGDGSQYMSSTELWSWLKQNSKRQLFYTETGSSLSEEQFMEKIQLRMLETGVPAKIVRKTVQWDRSNVSRTIFCVMPQTDVINPLACMVQFNHVGKYSFVEEKTFIMPPNLPEVPMSPLPENTTAKSLCKTLGLYGALLLILGFLLVSKAGALGACIIAASAVMLVLSYYFHTKNSAILAHNKKCAEQEKAWNDAWRNWQNSIFLHSFQEDINGQLSRVFDAVFECIKQVSAAEFPQVKAIMQEEKANMNDIEQSINFRKNEYR